MGFVNVNYVCRAKGARQAAAKAAKYYTFRDGPDLKERQWYAKDGRELNYDELRDQVTEHAQTYGYTYRLVVSTRDARLPIAEYQAVLGDNFAEHYLIEHANTDHPHAHVLGFTKQRIKAAELDRMKERLAERERAAELEQGKQLDQAGQLDQAHDGPAPRRQRENDIGLG